MQLAIEALVQHADQDLPFVVQNQRPDASRSIGLSEPELPSHLTTSGTGFTAALWEQSRVPLKTLFGRPLCYVTGHF